MKKTLALFGKILKSNLVKNMYPYKLTFAVTYKCNSKCKTCNIWKKKSENELSVSEIDKIFSKYNGFSWVDITGGEIFLRKDIVEITKIIIQKCRNLYVLHFPTNGLLPEIIVEKTKQILRLNPKKLIVSVSLDGPKEVNDKIRGVPGSFKNAVQTFSELKKIENRKLSVFFGFTLSRYNAGYFDKMVEEVKKTLPWIKYNNFHMNIMHGSAHYYHKNPLQVSHSTIKGGVYRNTCSDKRIFRMPETVPYTETKVTSFGTVSQHHNKTIEIPTKKVISEIREFMKKRKLVLSPVSYLEKIYLKLIKKYLITKKTPLPCKALSVSCFIDPHGFVYPCSIMDEKAGSLRDNSYDLKKILNSEKSKEIINKIRRGQCPMCWTPCEAYQTILGNLTRL